MSDNYGFDFNNDGKVSWEESHLTYNIERETARNNSLYDSLHKTKVSDDRRSSDTVARSDNTSSSASQTPKNSVAKDLMKAGLITLIVIAVLVGVLYLIYTFNSKIQQDAYYYNNQLNYNKGIEYIQKGEYRLAVDIFKSVNKNYFTDAEALVNYAWTLYHYERKNYVETYNHLEMCIDAVRLHPEFDSPDELMEEIKPLAEKQREATLKEIEELNRQIAEQNKKKQETTTTKKKNYSYSSDEYNVSDYYSAEDFYDDHYDDFFDYYDAEDYYEEHGGF